MREPFVTMWPRVMALKAIVGARHATVAMKTLAPALAIGSGRRRGSEEADRKALDSDVAGEAAYAERKRLTIRVKMVTDVPRNAVQSRDSAMGNRIAAARAVE